MYENPRGAWPPLSRCRRPCHQALKIYGYLANLNGRAHSYSNGNQLTMKEKGWQKSNSLNHLRTSTINVIWQHNSIN